MKHFECYLNKDELDTLINSLNRDYKEEDTETLEKEYQLQGKLREIIAQIRRTK